MRQIQTTKQMIIEKRHAMFLLCNAPFGVPDEDGNVIKRKYISKATQITIHVIRGVDTTLEGQLKSQTHKHNQTGSPVTLYPSSKLTQTVFDFQFTPES